MRRCDWKVGFSTLILIVFFGVLSGPSDGQDSIGRPGSLDSTFNSGGSGTQPGPNLVTVLPDGKIIIAGGYGTHNGIARFGMARLLADGTLDESFNADNPSGVNTVAPLAGGKLLVGGSFTFFNGTPAQGLVRLNENGTVDQAFTPEFKQVLGGTTVNRVLVQADGRILLTGSLLFPGETESRPIARLNTDGSRDLSFNAAVSQGIAGAALLPEGKILITGGFTTAQSQQSKLLKLLPDGSIDPTFEADIPSTFSPGPILVQPDGKIFLFSVQRIIRLMPDGSMDPSVGGNPTTAYSRVEQAVLQPDGKIVVSGSIDGVAASSVGLARLNRDGTPDLSFTANSLLGTMIRGIALDTHGNILASNSNGLVRLIGGEQSAPGGGTIEFAWSSAVFNEASGAATVHVVRKDGNEQPATVKYTVSAGTAVEGTDFTESSGTLQFAAGETTKAITILLANDTAVEADETLSVTLSDPSEGSVLGQQTSTTITIYDNDRAGRIDWRTSSTNISEASGEVVISLSRNGETVGAVSVDFETVAGTASAESDFTATNGTIPFADGENTKTVHIPIAEDTIREGAETFSVRIFNPTGSATLAERTVSTVTIVDNDSPGSLVESFQIGRILNHGINSVIPLENGQFLVAGPGDPYGWQPTERALARINADGSIDNSFTAQLPGNASVSQIIRQQDGRILVRGLFLQLNTTLRNDIIRLNQDGSVDSTFQAGPPNGTVTAMTLLPDGKILVGGDFAAIGGGNQGGLAKLLPNGSLDRSFLPTRPAGSILALLFQPDGRILVGGEFPQVGTRQTAGICRLHPGGELDEDFVVDSALRIHFTKVRTIALQADNRILIGGDLYFNDEPKRTILRLNANGSIDNSFAIIPAVDSFDMVSSIIVQADGRILVGGNFPSIAGLARQSVARLNSDGTGDVTFDSGSHAYSAPMVLLPNGNLITGSSIERQLVELVGGNLDIPGPGVLGFGSPSLDINEAAGAVVIPVIRTGGNLDVATVSFTTGDGSTVVGTNYTRVSGSLTFSPRDTVKQIVVPITDNAAPNLASQFSVTLSNPQGADLSERASVVVTIYDDERPGRLQFENATYTLRESGGSISMKVVRTHGTQGRVTVNFATEDTTATVGSDYTASSGTLVFEENEVEKTISIPAVKDGKVEGDEGFDVVLASPTGAATLGPKSAASVTIYDIDDPGSLVESFAPLFQSTPSPKVWATALQSGGKLLIGGSFLSVDGLHRSLARLNPDGSLDPSFRATNFSGTVYAIALQSDGKLIVGGEFRWSQGTTVRDNLARVNSDGTIDVTFAPPAPNAGVYTIGILSDSSVVVGGKFSKLGSTSRPSLVRLSSTGTLDTSFQPNLATYDNPVNRLIVGSSDRILYLGGRNRVVRLNTDGSADSNFSTALSWSDNTAQLLAIAFDNEGRMLVSGYFPTTPSGAARPKLVRLRADGTTDPSFQVPTTIPTPPEAITVQADGRILISTSGQDPLRVIRLLDTGAIEPAFRVIASSSSGGTLSVSGLAIVADNTVIVTGSFSTLDGLPRPAIGRLLLGAQPGTFRFASGARMNATETDGEAVVAINRIGGVDGPSSIQYTTENGSAFADEDYTSTSGTLEFADGETTKTIRVPLVNDTRYEHGKTVKIRLSNPVGSFLANSAELLTIDLSSDDPRRPGSLQFTTDQVSINEDEGTVVLTVSRTEGSDENVEVQFATVDGTARANIDYVPTSGTLSFTDGEVSQEIRVTVLRDQLAEVPQTFTVQLSEPGNGGSLGSPASVTVTITDDDTRAIDSFRGTYTGLLASEASGYNGFVTISLSAKSVATGSLLLNGTRVPFRGTLDPDGLLTLTLSKHGFPELLMKLQLDTTSEHGRFTGTVEEAGIVLDLTAEHHAFDARSNPAPMAGRYTLIFERDPANTDDPIGAGYGLVTVEKSGAVRLQGSLADGTKITQSAFLSKGGTWPLFSSLYSKGGIVGGQITLAGEGAWDCSGAAVWIRPAQERSRYYAGGFTTELTISGSRLKPVSGKQLLAMTSGQITLMGGDLAEPITAAVRQVASNRFSVEKLPEKVSLTLNPTTGLIGGRFVHPVTRRPAVFQGVVLPDENRATGFFVGPTSGGAVNLNAQQN